MIPLALKLFQYNQGQSGSPWRNLNSILIQIFIVHIFDGREWFRMATNNNIE